MSQRWMRWGFASYLGLLVLLPLLAVLLVAFGSGWQGFWGAVSAPSAAAALWLTLWTSLLVGLFHLVFGSLTAWVLVRYEFPGRALLSALVDLPLSLPTLVAGILIAVLYGPDSYLSRLLGGWGIEVLYESQAIFLALAFVTLPFVVRGVEPVLHEIDPAEEEAARVLGAGPLRTFMTVHFPVMAKAGLASSVRVVGRALGEFGAVVVVSGNIPFKTLTGPVYVFGEIESGQTQAAAAVSVALLAFAVLLHRASEVLSARLGARGV